jgi:serine/threonine protein phosphatase PrpC
MPALTLACASRTETGRRANNEDSVFASPRLAVVADGVGGAAAGEVASQWMVQALISLDKSRLSTTLELAVADAIAWGNQTIRFIAESHPPMAGMSTTLTAIALADDGAYVLANIGDSRTYLLRDDALKQLSRDDSFVQELLDNGYVTAEQARSHPARSLVLQALDGDPERRAAIERIAACEGDRLLLCSDGLSDVVDDETLAAVLREEPERDACTDRLVELALDRGARDNVTVVVADVNALGDDTLWPPALQR